MNEQLITKEVAELAKQAGFDWECLHFYHANQEPYEYSFKVNANQLSEDNFGYGITCSAPTQTILSKWLREVHKIYIELIIDGWGSDELVSEEHLCYRAFIWKVGEPRPKPHHDLGCGKYEKILEIALHTTLIFYFESLKKQ